MNPPTIVLQLPIWDQSSAFDLPTRISNECDVKYHAGYQLAGTFSPTPNTVVLVFQLPVKP